MKIRAITAFTDIQADTFAKPIAEAGQSLSDASDAFLEAGIEVQSRRLATQPFPQYGIASAKAIPDLVLRLNAECVAQYIDYLSLGPVSAEDDPDYIDVITDVLRAVPNVFAAVEIAHAQRGMDLDILRRTARLIQSLSQLSADGMGNLFMAALANFPPGSP